jgi:hypothetical protein
MYRLTIAILTILAAPATAQSLPDSATLFDQFTTRCAAIRADPEAAIAAAFGDPNGSGGAVTSDKALLTYQEPLLTPGEMPDDIGAILFYNRNQTAGGREDYCNLTVNALFADKTALNLTDLPDVIGARAEAVLGGPVTKLGSPVLQQGQAAQMYLFTTGDGFPASSALQVMQADGFVTLSLAIRTPN